MFLQPAGVKDYTTLLLCSYPTTSDIQLSIEILGPLPLCARFRQGWGRESAQDNAPVARFVWLALAARIVPSSFHAMQCDAMRCKAASLASPVSPASLPPSKRRPGACSVEGPQQSVPTAPLPLIVQGSCRFRNASSRVCGTTSPPPQLSVRPASLSLSTSAFELARCCRSNGQWPAVGPFMASAHSMT